MTWQPWASPEGGEVVTWQNEYGTEKSKTTCVAFKDAVTCDWP
ncbi:hypothetical protein [Tsukamurella sp. 1534]|nr:hypothetical protein [Tsukamurella sp. 1534]